MLFIVILEYAYSSNEWRVSYLSDTFYPPKRVICKVLNTSKIRLETIQISYL